MKSKNNNRGALKPLTTKRRRFKMYIIKLNGVIIGVEELTREEAKKEEAAGFTLIKIQ